MGTYAEAIGRLYRIASAIPRIGGTANEKEPPAYLHYYADTPPIPAFCTDNKGPQSWSGANALLYRVRGSAPAGLANVADGALLGSFTVSG